MHLAIAIGMVEETEFPNAIANKRRHDECQYDGYAAER